MDPVAMIIGTSWTVTGLIAIAVCIPLAQGRVGRNRFYGIRLSQSFRSDDAWFAINRYGARRMIVWSLPLILLGIGSFFVPLQAHPALAIAIGFVPCIFVLMPALEIFRFAQRYHSKT